MPQGREDKSGLTASGPAALVPNLDFIYEKLVASGSLECLLLAPKANSSLQARVKRVLKSVYGLHENHFPDDLKKEWHILLSVYDHKISPQNSWRLNPVDGKVQNLKPKEAKRILQAFLTIIVEVIKGLDATSKWKRRKHTGI